MRIGRTLPPAAAPIGFRQLISGIQGLGKGKRELDRFNNELKTYFGVKHCFLVSSGKAALALTLMALKELFPTRDEVLIPAFTCYSVPSAIIRAGLKVRLCDLDMNTLDFDFVKLSTLLSRTSHLQHDESFSHVTNGNTSSVEQSANNPSEQRLLAIIPTHLFGIPADVSRLKELLQVPAVTVVEDAAQAMGETCKGKKLGTLGDVGFFSLGRGKVLSTVEGGVIITNRDDIAAQLEHHIAKLPSYNSWKQISLILKAIALTFLMHPLLFWIPRAMPFLKLGETFLDPHFTMLKMSSFQAGLASNWQAALKKHQDVRKKNVKRWLAVLERQKINGLQIHDFGQVHGLIRFPIRIRDIKERASLLLQSDRIGLGIMPSYPDSIDSVLGLRRKQDQKFSVAESYAKELVTLPTHAYVTQRDIKKIGELLFKIRHSA